MNNTDPKCNKNGVVHFNFEVFTDNHTQTHTEWFIIKTFGVFSLLFTSFVLAGVYLISYVYYLEAIAVCPSYLILHDIYTEIVTTMEVKYLNSRFRFIE
jgi:hypothetical protein